MEWLTPALQLGATIFLSVVAFFGLVVAVPVWLHHRRSVLKMTSQRGRDVEALHKRIDELEKQCRKLQDQVTEAHVLLADERRELDKRLEKKLAEIAPDASAIPDEPADQHARGKRGRVRE